MKTNAIKRFKYQQLLVANSLRSYISRAIDGNNDQFGIETSSQITDKEAMVEELDDNPEALDELLEYNLRRLPKGFNLKGYLLLMQSAIEERVRSGDKLTDEQ